MLLCGKKLVKSFSNSTNRQGVPAALKIARLFLCKIVHCHGRGEIGLGNRQRFGTQTTQAKMEPTRALEKYEEKNCMDGKAGQILDCWTGNDWMMMMILHDLGGCRVFILQDARYTYIFISLFFLLAFLGETCWSKLQPQCKVPLFLYLMILPIPDTSIVPSTIHNGYLAEITKHAAILATRSLGFANNPPLLKSNSRGNCRIPENT